MTLSTSYEPTKKERILPLLKETLFALLGSALIALSAQFAIPLPFAAVPITMQTFAVLLLAGFGGSRMAVNSCLVYLVEGTFGLPVFAQGISCPFWFITPRVGYLVGFVVAAYLVGRYSKTASLAKKLFLFVASEALILFSGWLGLLCFAAPVGAFFAGVAPFLAGAIYKSVSAALIVHGITIRR
jgi:biotin transport system substrate-specific component